MKYSVVLQFIAFESVLSRVLHPRDCHENNCLREIIGTDPHITPTLSSRYADCSSFLKATVAPASTWVSPCVALNFSHYPYTNSNRDARTVTITFTSTSTISAAALPKRNAILAARQVTVIPSSVLAYATPFYAPSAAYIVCQRNN